MRLLYVTSDKDNYSFIENHPDLENRLLKCDFVSSRAEAQRALDSNKYCAIISSYYISRLEDESEFETFLKVWEKEFSHIPFVLFTTSREFTCERASNLKNFHMIDKLRNSVALVPLLLKLLNKR